MDITRIMRKAWLASSSKVSPRHGQQTAEGAGESARPLTEPGTPGIPGPGATSEASVPLPGQGNTSPQAGEKTLPLSGTGASSPSPVYPQEMLGSNQPLFAAEAPAAGNPPAPETGKAKDPAIDDIMGLFTEEDPMDESLRQLAGGLDQVTIDDLINQCREVAGLLERRQGWRS